MKCCGLLMAGIAVLTGTASAQGLVGDVFSGKLIKPEVGVYAWYSLKDNATNQRFLLRQAVVGEHKVNGEKGYWVETQVIPEVGFPTIYKMLVTGPANDARNVHKIIVKEGQKSPVEIPLDPNQKESEDTSKKENRETVGKEKIATEQGEIEADHVIISKSLANSAAAPLQVEVWLNDDVRPMGIVKMTSPSGDLMLQRYGKGGPDGTSAIDALQQSEDPTAPTTNVKVNVEAGKPIKKDGASAPPGTGKETEGEKTDGKK